MAECKESDWKLFRVKVVDWQENYMARLNQKIIKILSDENKTQSDRFWKASKILASEKKISWRCMRIETQHAQVEYRFSYKPKSHYDG